MIKNIANIITTGRILASIFLLFFPAFSPEFYIIYIICGLSDMIDGTIARKTHSSSEFGEKIDTAADIVFAAAAMIKILPSLYMPLWIWIWGALIAIIKIANIMRGYVSQKRFIALHSRMNKITGLLLFLLPLTSSFIDVKYSSVIICSMATFAAIQEGIYIVKNPDANVSK